jgi:hypothetical protein
LIAVQRGGHQLSVRSSAAIREVSPNAHRGRDQMAQSWRHSDTWQTSEFGKAILSFLGFIVQSAFIGGIDPDTTAKRWRE